MTDDRRHTFGFADPQDEPIAYRERIRGYYRALGYGAPYEWAHYADVPFKPLRLALAQARVALITTAAPYQPDKGDQGPGAPYNAAAKFYQVYSGDSALDPDLRIAHVAIDRDHTSAVDPGSYFPLPALRAAAAAGQIGSVAARFHGVPTKRSHHATLAIDGPELVSRCRADGADAALLAANCPVCHQTLSLCARLLEAAGISTVLMGCAKDIVEYIGVPRLLFSDFPLGNAAGKPGDVASQRQTLALALQLLAQAPAPRCTLQSAQHWREDAGWKADYSNADRLSAEEIQRRRVEFDRGKAQASQLRQRAGLSDR